MTKLASGVSMLVATAQAQKPKGSHQNRKTCKSVEYYTPGWLVASAVQVLGQIDLDPASSEVANRVVGATRYYDNHLIRAGQWRGTEWKDGLAEPWGSSDRPGTIFLNYPSDAKQWWIKLLAERKAQHISHAIVVAYSADPLFHTQSGCGLGMADFPVCLLRTRVPYLVEGPDSRLYPKKGTPCYSAVVYVPGVGLNGLNRTDRFYEVFSQYGRVMVPYKPSYSNL